MMNGTQKAIVAGPKSQSEPSAAQLEDRARSAGHVGPATTTPGGSTPFSPAPTPCYPPVNTTLNPPITLPWHFDQENP